MKLVYIDEHGRESTVGFCATNAFFGENSLIMDARARFRAIAVEPTSTMCWASADLSERIIKEPKLGIALIKWAAGRSVSVANKLVADSSMVSGMRVASALIELAEQVGEKCDTATYRITRITHQDIAEYAGTTRPCVTFNLNRLRRFGYLRYDRKGIILAPNDLRRDLRTLCFASSYKASLETGEKLFRLAGRPHGTIAARSSAQ